MSAGPGRREGGVALVTAVLVVALAAFLAATVLRSLMLDLRRGAQLQATEQAYQYARGLEAWAVAILADDYEQTGALDHRGEAWAKGIPFIDVPGGRLTGRMTDLDGRFNLNNLVVAGQRQERQVAVFRRLLTILGLDPAIAERAVDWIDADVTPGRGGAEDGEYLRREPPYRTANRPFAHVSELRAVAGVDGGTWRRLSPYVAALPVAGDPQPVNLNTAEPPVIAALHEAIDLPLAEEFARGQGRRFESVDQFLSHPRLELIDTTELRLLVATQSRWFQAEGIVELGGVSQRFHAILERRFGRARVVFHSRGAF